MDLMKCTVIQSYHYRNKIRFLFGMNWISTLKKKKLLVTPCQFVDCFEFDVFVYQTSEVKFHTHLHVLNLMLPLVKMCFGKSRFMLRDLMERSGHHEIMWAKRCAGACYSFYSHLSVKTFHQAEASLGKRQ